MSNTALERSKAEVLSLKGRLRAARADARFTVVDYGTMGAAAVAGAALAGTIRGAVGDLPAISTDAAVGLPLVGAGIALGKPSLVFAGIGPLCHLAGERTESIGSRILEKLKPNQAPR
jgi:hypothetical protein